MPKQEFDYQKLSAELDEILANLQDPDTGLDESMKLYKRGREIIKQLESYLEQAENSVRTISGEKA